MNDKAQIVDLNEAFGKALLQQFFEPLLVGRSPDGSGMYAPSGVSIMAQELFRNQSRLIMDEVWGRLDMDVLAGKIADLVVADLTRAGTYYNPNSHRDKLLTQVQEVVAQQLGQRVVDQMDLHIGPKEISDVPQDA